MDEDQAVAFESLHDETFSAKESDGEFLLKCDTNLYAACSGQKAVLLADQLATKLAQIDGENLAGEGRGKREFLALGGVIGVDRDEERFARQESLASTQQFAQQARRRLTTVTKQGIHGDSGFHVHEATRLTHHGFAGVEFAFNELHLRADDSIIDYIHGHRVPSSVANELYPETVTANRKPPLVRSPTLRDGPP